MREQPRIFAVAAAGSVVFGALTSLDAWALGWATSDVLLPALDSGRMPATGLLLTVPAVFGGLALLRATGIFSRWLGAKVMQFRLQSAYRRRVTAKYLAMPVSALQRRPTGQVLSNASSDVEAAWSPLSELPMGVGVAVMVVFAVVQMLLVDPLMAAAGLLVIPLTAIVTVVHHSRSAALTARQQVVRAELSQVAHESFDGALVVKTLGRADAETERFAAKSRELRDVSIRLGRLRAAFDPVLEAIPSFGVFAVLAIGSWQVSRGSSTPGDMVTIAYLLTVIAA
ncbi:MAG: ABC transporter ATP-binding protein, partial [Gordonia sp. (in: high G+C Gram-positive bacteria)]